MGCLGWGHTHKYGQEDGSLDHPPVGTAVVIPAAVGEENKPVYSSGLILLPRLHKGLQAPPENRRSIKTNCCPIPSILSFPSKRVVPWLAQGARGQEEEKRWLPLPMVVVLQPGGHPHTHRQHGDTCRDTVSPHGSGSSLQPLSTTPHPGALEITAG